LCRSHLLWHNVFQITLRMGKVRSIKFLGYFLFLSLLITACNQGRQLPLIESQSQQQDVGPFSILPEFQDEYATSEEGIAALESRILDLNKSIEEIESVIENQTAIELKEFWLALDQKRIGLNVEIDRFNNALEEGAELEARETRARINFFLAEIEDDLKNIQRLFME
jgi:hypothetical protein